MWKPILPILNCHRKGAEQNIVGESILAYAIRQSRAYEFKPSRFCPVSVGSPPWHELSGPELALYGWWCMEQSI